LIAACESFVFAFLPSPIRLVFLVVILAISLLVPRNISTIQTTESSPVGARTDVLISEKREAPVVESPWVRFYGVFSRNWVVFGGLLLCVTVQSGTWSDYLIFNPGFDGPVSYYFLHSVFGLMLGAFAVLLTVQLLKDLAIRVIYLIAPLICVACLVIIWFFGDWIISGGLFSFLPLGFSLAVCGILHITRLSRELGKGLSPLLVFGPFIVFTLLLFLVWFAVFPLIGWTASSIVDLILKITFLVAVSVQTTVLTQRHPIIAAQIANQPLADVCAEISERFSLSPRESEILLYLVQGRSASYIAERQFVTTSTIKTHTQRIFRKTGVHSKQELLDLVYKLDAS
jgi:DNA-binding CsgD family transcriptional regulator